MKTRAHWLGLVILSLLGVGRALGQSMDSDYRYRGPSFPSNAKYYSSYPAQPLFPRNSLTQLAYPLAGTPQNPYRGQYFRPSMADMSDSYIPTLGFYNKSPRNPLSTFETARSRGMRTRGDQARTMANEKFPLRARPRKGQTEAYNPITKMLGDRNFLSARSPLGKETSARASKIAAFESEAEAATNNTLITGVKHAQPTTSPGEQTSGDLDSRIAARKVEYLAMGTAYFRDRKYIDARNSFNQIMDLENSSARPFVCSMLSSYHNQDFQQAEGSMLRAIQRAKTLEDLRIDKTQFYPDNQIFQRALDQIEVEAKRSPDNPGANAFLGYFAWLNNDTVTAISAFDASIHVLPDSNFKTQITKIRDMVAADMSKPTITSPQNAGVPAAGRAPASAPVH